jgi:hypothetical protein
MLNAWVVRGNDAPRAALDVLVSDVRAKYCEAIIQAERAVDRSGDCGPGDERIVNPNTQIPIRELEQRLLAR